MLAKIGAVNRDFHYEGLETMADLQAKFEQAVADSKNLPEKPDNMTLLRLYALYKQASSGDAEGKRGTALPANRSRTRRRNTSSWLNR